MTGVTSNDSPSGGDLSPLHLRIQVAASGRPAEAPPVFGAEETIKYAIDDLVFGDRHSEWIHELKAQFVHADRDPIKISAEMFDVPPELVTGILYLYCARTRLAVAKEGILARRAITTAGAALDLGSNCRASRSWQRG